MLHRLTVLQRQLPGRQRFVVEPRNRRLKPCSSATQSLAHSQTSVENTNTWPTPQVMVNSCTGKMGHATAEAAVRAGLELVPFTFTGYSTGVAVSNIGVAGVPIELVGPEKQQEVIERVKELYPNLIIVDFTLPSCVNENAEVYIRNRVPFIMGTTGGDRDKLLQDTLATGVYAVISPQMGKQVVAFQGMVDLMAQNFPGAFAGYNLSVVESHQSTKPDVSGTARAVVKSFQQLGIDFDENAIRKVRDPMTQLEVMGVPEEALGGHAFHTYTLTSPDGSVRFVFKHNVTYRSTYAEGTVDAVLFLAKKIHERAEQRVYTMLDVLREGALR